MTKSQHSGPDYDAMSRDWQAMLNVLGENFRRVAASYVNAWKDWQETPSGQHLLALARYYDAHPEELRRIIANRNAEAAIPDCHCLCPRWSDHAGQCKAISSTARTFPTAEVPMCGPCAQAFDTRRTLIQS